MQDSGDAKQDLPSPPPVRSFLPAGLPPRGPLVTGGLVLKKSTHGAERELGSTVASAEELETKNATAYMRELDSCRLHRPSAAERQLLNLPESVERLNLHDAKHFMNGCGFSRGLRFTSDEISQVHAHVRALAVTFKEIESVFQRLPPNARRAALNDIDSVPSAEWRKDLQVLVEQGRAYLGTYGQAMALLRRKQGELKGREMEATPSSPSQKPQADEEDAAAAPFPEYLSVLLAKYHTGAAVDSIGKLANFLAHCLFAEGQLTEHEAEAMAVLIDASDDNSASASPLSPRSHALHGRPQRYWACRLHAFLCSLSELKSSSKGAADLKEFGHWPKPKAEHKCAER